MPVELTALVMRPKQQYGPLLDDININGARGILVNVAAADLTMGEFMEVGDMVEEFASENATVVVGTVIDESLGDDLMVTIVATGLDKASKPSIVVSNEIRSTTLARMVTTRVLMSRLICVIRFATAMQWKVSIFKARIWTISMCQRFCEDKRIKPVSAGYRALRGGELKRRYDMTRSRHCPRQICNRP